MTPLAQLFREAIAACDPAAATAAALRGIELVRGRRVWVAAAGKAAAAMVRGAEQVVTIEDRIVVTPADAAHPVPDARSEAAGRAMLAFAAKVPRDAVMVALISGGASSLIAVPATGFTLAEKVARVGQVVARGAPIAEINRARTALSAIKGGRLAAACAAPVVTVACSDVVGDDLAVIGSGPTVGPVRRPGDVAVLASGLGALARAAAAAAPVPSTIVDDGVTGDVADVAARIVSAIRAATPPRALIWTGEPTVTLPANPGRGGRARQLALEVAKALAGVPGWSLLAAGSDGVDGTADAAGAIVDGATWDAIPDGDAFLAARDAGTALARFALVTGPTGVNHADLYVAQISANRGPGTGNGERGMSEL